MAKALKIAAVVVGVAALAVVTGGAAAGLGLSLATTLTVGGAYISAGALLVGAAALGVGASLLANKPTVTASQTERLNANVDPRAFRKTWLGQTAGAVDVRYEEWSGKDQEICDWIIAFASHAIDGLEEIWFDTEMAWSATTGVVGKYVGYFSIPNLILEGTPQNAFTFASGKWNANTARMTGCAYARFRFKVTGNSKKAESPFSSGIPSRITVIGRGAKLYDPRRDSTVPGGSGPMRWNDQSTWRYTADDGVVIGENLPLQILRVVLGWRIRNPSTGVMKLATGSGVPGRRISFPSFQIAANIADELVNRSAGGNEPRYHGAGVISEGDDQKTVLDMLCAACCSRFRDTGGKLALVVSHNDLAAAATDDGLNDDDVVGAFTWDPDPSLEATPNIVRGKYVDPTTASLYQLMDYPEVSLPSPDGQDRYLSLDLGVVESPSQAQRIAKQVLQRRQYARQFTAPFDIRAWKYGVGDVLPFTFAPLGFTRALFRVKEQELGQGGTCNMVLTFETPDFYLWDASDALPVQAADPIVYDSRNNPLILAIGEAATTAFWENVTGAGKPADNADVTGDHVSKDTNAVAGKPAQVVLTDMNSFITTLAQQTGRVDGFRDVLTAIGYVAGQPVNAGLIREIDERKTDVSAVRSDLSLAFAKNASGTAAKLTSDLLLADESQTVAQAFAGLIAENGENSAQVQQIMSAMVTPSGNAEAMFTLVGKANGTIVGIRGTATGDVGKLVFAANEWAFEDTDSGQAFYPFSYRDKLLRATNMEVDTFKPGSIDISAIKVGLSQVLTFTGPDIRIGNNEATLIEATGVVIGDAVGGRALATVSFTHDATLVGDAGTRFCLYVDTGSGYELKRDAPVGTRTTAGNTFSAIPVSFNVTISATVPVKIKLTVQAYAIPGAGGAAGTGHYARNANIDLLRLAR